MLPKEAAAALWSEFVQKEFMEEIPEVTATQLGSCLGCEFGVS